MRIRLVTPVICSLIVAATAGSSGVASPLRARLADFAVATEPTWSPDGRQIAFTASLKPGQRSPRDLYVMKVDGSAVRRLTPTGSDVAWPTWAASGGTIAFERWTKTENGFGADIYAVSPAGGRMQELVPDGRTPTWAPHSRALAFARATRLGNDRILVASPGGRIRVVADSHNECESFDEPTWSPDGERIAFWATGAGGECGGDNFIGTSRGYGAKVRRVANAWFTEPSWSPNGKELAVTRFSPENAWKVVIARYDLRTRRATYLRAGWHPTWSPNGRRLLFVSGNPSHSRSRIYVMRRDGAMPEPLTR